MWIKLARHPSGETVAINMGNVWRMEPQRDGTTELHSLGANTAGSSASVTVEQSVDAILSLIEQASRRS